MATTAPEDGVLKLVHPGRHVEIHREPILAAEVMKKNPRHSVTRPDIFEFPWVVVKPESVLVPGKVFLIVPNRTIYRLTKEHKRRNQSTLLQPSQPERSLDHHQSQKQKSNAGVTPKHQTQSQCLKTPGLALCWDPEAASPSPSPREQEHGRSNHPAKHHQQSSKQKSAAGQGLKKPVQTSCWSSASVSPREPDWDKKVKRQSQVGSWPETSSKDKNHRTNLAGSGVRIRSPQDVSTYDDKSTALVIHGDPEPKCRNLKSCLRKHDSAPKLQHHRVTFVLPNEDEEKQE